MLRECFACSCEVEISVTKFNECDAWAWIGVVQMICEITGEYAIPENFGKDTNNSRVCRASSNHLKVGVRFANP